MEELPLLPLSGLVKFGFPGAVSSSPGHGPIFPVRRNFLKNVRITRTNVVFGGRKMIKSNIVHI